MSSCYKVHHPYSTRAWMKTCKYDPQQNVLKPLGMFQTEKISAISKSRYIPQMSRVPPACNLSTPSGLNFNTYLFNSSTNRSIGSVSHQLTTPIQTQQTRHFSIESFYRTFSPDFFPIKISYDFLTYIHTLTGLPWWASVALSTVLLRSFITLPLAVYSTYILARVENLQPEIRKLSHRMKIETAKAIREFGWDMEHARIRYNYSMKKVVRDLYIQENCHPGKASVLVWIQLPMWIALSFTLRYMTGFTPEMNLENSLFHPELVHEGTLWFKNMTLPDSTWILPISLGLVNLTIIEIYALQRTNSTLFTRAVTNLVRGLSILMIPIGANVPSCMCWYWLCSSLYGLSQNLAFQLPTVRRAIGIPATPSECNTPYQRLYTAAKNKYSLRRKTKE